MIISAEQLHGLLAAIRDQKIAVVETTGLRQVGPGLIPGEQVRVDVLARLPSGQSLTSLAGQLVNMQLPADVKPGDILRMTYVSGEPRPTFALSQSERLGTPTSVSDTARWLGQITREPAATSAPPLVRPTQLLTTPPDNPQQLAERLRQVVSQSGLFYETHLAEWATGERPLASILQEPQGGLSQPTAFQKATTSGVPPQSTMPMPTPPSLPQPSNAAPAPPGSTLIQGQPETAAAPVTAMPPTPGAPSPVRADTIPIPTAPTASTPTAAATIADARQSAPSGQTASANPAAPTLPSGSGTATSSSPGNTAAPTLPDSASALPAAPGQVAGDISYGSPPTATVFSQRTEPQEATNRPLHLGIHAPGTNDRGDTSPAATTAGSTRDAEAAKYGTTTAPSGSPLPQAEPADPRTIPLIREQLELLQQRTFSWQGEGWPGQPLQWQVEERDANPDQALPRSWHSSVHLELPRLGTVHATLKLTGTAVSIAITGSTATSVTALQATTGKLREQLEAHGLALNGCEIRNE